MNPIRRPLTVAAAAVLLVAGCSSSTRLANTSSPSTTVAESTTTSGAVATSTTMATTTVPATAPPTTAAPATVAPTVPSGATALGAPTNLQPTPGGGITLTGDPCTGGDPGIPGWTVDDCQYMPSYSNGVQALVLHRNDDGRLAVAVLFQTGTTWTQRYFAGEDEPGIWDSVTVQVGDFHFDDGAEVWVGYRDAGSGGYLDLDVLDPLPGGTVFLGGLQSLDHGVVDVHPGGATVQTAVYGPSDPNCCPSQFLQREVTWAADQWWVDAGTTYPADAAPPITGDF